MERTIDQYVTNRAEMVPFVPASAKKVLDVGCAQGKFGEVLKLARPQIDLWGMDPVSGSRPVAYDHFVEGFFPDSAPREAFDVIVFNDVLEHMVDPWTALRLTRQMLAVDGVVVASIPNVRNLRTLGQLVFRGEWNYVDAGVLDRTHLRFFTASTMRTLFSSSGYVVETLRPINLPRIGKRGILRRTLLGLADELFAEQFVVVARPGGAR